MGTKVSLLDCSFRDGGYRTNWHFSQARVLSAYSLASSLGVDFLELGFRFPTRSSELGPFSNVSDSLLENIKKPAGPSVGFMVESKAFNSFSSLDEFAKWATLNTTSFNFIRIATTIEDLKSSIEVASRFDSLGFQTFVNVMRMSELERSDLSLLLRLKDSPTICYLADSYGNLRPNEVKNQIDFLVSNGIRSGFHAHNNRGLAFANSLAAIDAGCEFVDGTLAGHGRGSGNTKLEELALELSGSTFELATLFHLGNHLETFEYTEDQMRGETSFAFHLGAKLGLHPNFIMDLLQSNTRMSLGDALCVISEEGAGRRDETENKPAKTSIRNVDFGISSHNPTSALSPLQDAICVLVGAGELAERDYENALFFKKESKVCFIALNHIPAFMKSADALFAMHSFRWPRILNENFAKSNHVITSFPISGVPYRKENGVVPIGEIKEDVFNAHGDKLVLPHPTVLAYALCLCARFGAKEVSLAGFGLSPDSEDFSEQDKLIRVFQKQFPNLPVTELSPSGHKLERSSLW
jgi:4-hydroxy 2-oxovalerate aldolase